MDKVHNTESEQWSFAFLFYWGFWFGFYPWSYFGSLQLLGLPYYGHQSYTV